MEKNRMMKVTYADKSPIKKKLGNSRPTTGKGMERKPNLKDNAPRKGTAC